MELRHVEAAAGLPIGAGPELAKALVAEGLIRKLKNDAWTMCQAGMTFTAATAAKRLTRATADRALATFMERVVRVNSDPYFLGKVTRVALFGSMLNPNADRPSDIDLAVEVVPKIADRDSHIEKNNERVQELMTLGHHFRHSIEYAACWQLEVFRYLKGRSRAISLADYNIEKRLVRRWRTGCCWATMNGRQFQLTILPFHASAVDHGTVRFDGRITRCHTSTEKRVLGCNRDRQFSSTSRPLG
jgi:predicted nucleotidyltransferase